MELQQARAMARAQEWNTFLSQKLVHQPLVCGVERTGRFVEERIPRMVEQEPREGEPLLLTRRKDVSPRHLDVKSTESLAESREIYCSKRILKLFIAPSSSSWIGQLIAQRTQDHVGPLR